MIVKICIGSSCHLKGLARGGRKAAGAGGGKGAGGQSGTGEQILHGNCANGVCVSIDDENFEHIGRTTWIPSSKTK